MAIIVCEINTVPIRDVTARKQDEGDKKDNTSSLYATKLSCMLSGKSN